MDRESGGCTEFMRGCGTGPEVYYRADPAMREANSPLGLVERYTGQYVPVYLWSAEYDPSNIESSVAGSIRGACYKYADCPMYTQWQDTTMSLT